MSLTAQLTGAGWTVNMVSAPGEIMMAQNMNTDANGSIALVLPQAGLLCDVSINTPGQYSVERVTNGNNLTINVKKVKAALGLTLGTLLTASVFEDVTGVVNFDFLAFKAT